MRDLTWAVLVDGESWGEYETEEQALLAVEDLTDDDALDAEVYVDQVVPCVMGNTMFFGSVICEHCGSNCPCMVCRAHDHETCDECATDY